MQSLQERFWNKVARRGPAECWEWQGYRASSGHGRVSLGFSAKGERLRDGAHRWAWVLTNGPIPDGLCVCHRCDNPPCCNPVHLFLGSHAENQRDRHEKGRDARGSRHGIARLNELQVCGIMARYLQGKQQNHIAAEYGVSPNTICRIVNRTVWQHIFR